MLCVPLSLGVTRVSYWGVGKVEVGCFEERLERMKDGEEEASELKWKRKGVSDRQTHEIRFTLPRMR